MAAPERLNVLLSRARDALIMIGNSETFINAKKGRQVWRKLFDHLKENGHVYEGFPVKCEKHPDRAALLSTPETFESACPDGGCREPWYVDQSSEYTSTTNIPMQRCASQMRFAQLSQQLSSDIRPFQDEMRGYHGEEMH
jgi:hypothetical protein